MPKTTLKRFLIRFAQPLALSACLPLTMLPGQHSAADISNASALVVVTDTPVIHSLASMVMQQIASPTLLMAGSTSPHNYTLRPSEAAALQSADVLIWTSRYLTPWLKQATQATASDTTELELMAAPKTLKLEYRTNNLFSAAHEHEQTGMQENDNAEHNARLDPHGWLDPDNAIYWLDLIAEQLAELDPDNATLFRANAKSAQQQLNELQMNITHKLAPYRGRPFFVFHDSYHYFEERYQLFAEAAIALSDAQLPGIRQMNALRSQLDSYDSVCVFTEPQFSDKLVNSLIRGLDVNVAVLDPLGSQLSMGPGLYIDIVEQLSDTLAECLGKLPSP